jgi:membrane-bound ClpP family serine protease
MNDDQKLVWVNKKTGLIASDSELNEMWEKPQHDFELKQIPQKENNENAKTLSENNNIIGLKEPISGATIAWLFISINLTFLLFNLPGLVCCSIIVIIPLYICFLIWTQNEYSAITKLILIITFLFLLYRIGLFMVELAWQASGPDFSW